MDVANAGFLMAISRATTPVAVMTSYCAEVRTRPTEGFRTALSKVGKGRGKKGGNGNNNDPEPDISFDAKIYPQFRRFSIFVDRRNKKPRLNKEDKEDEKENKEQNLDQITFFQPPDAYSTMQTGHVHEIGFEFLRKCLLPQRIQQKEKNITALQG